jgi:demethylmenaquinone methyltransferase / 2-methoxy-6-polyprenyl-1,4-benzoquinol methylase
MSVALSRRRPNEFARALFSGLPRRYDRLAAVLSFGQDGRWRRAMVDQVVPDQPRLVLDVATGPAGVARQLARRTRAVVIGVDLNEPMIRQAVATVRRDGLTERIDLVVGRAEQLPFPDATFDALTFTYLLRYVADPAATLVELARVVKPGGAIAGLEFAVPTRRAWRALWRCYTRIVLPAAGGVGGGRAWFDVGRFLGPSIEEHYRRYPVPWIIDAWRAAGISDVDARTMSLGGGIVQWGRRDR